eukprot:s555_g11.t1
MRRQSFVSPEKKRADLRTSLTIAAIARLALKLDAQATAREDAQVAQQAALAAPPPPPPPPPPPGGEMSSAVDAFLSQGSPANPVAASAVDAYLQQGTTAPLENPFAPGRARPAFGAGALGPGGGSTSLTLGPAVVVAEAWEAVEVAGVVEASEVSVAAAAAPAWAAAARALGPPVAEAARLTQPGPCRTSSRRRGDDIGHR